MSARRRAGVTDVDTPSDCEARITRVVDAPRHLVFKAWTDPAIVPRWLLGPEGWTMPVCEMDLRPGGTWRYVWRKADGAELAMTGSYREVVPPERIVSTERWGPEWPETVNTVVFTEAAGQTTITLTILYPSREARDAAMRTGMTAGADQSFARLDRVLATMA
jgi:uncharacterized protein YndB with AHSA1/START domain